MMPIRYPPGTRFADWYHGWRDGRAWIPDRDAPTEHVTTPHREMLIRLAQEVFEHERLRYERARDDAPERIAGLTARLDQLYAHRADVERQLAEIRRPLSAEDKTWRRIGDLDRAEQVVIQRRQTEQRRRANAARLTLDSIIAEIGRAEGELAKAKEADRRELQVATSRVLRFHEYIHRRLDCYLRSLIRVHPDGAWVGAHLIVPSFLPGWIPPEARVTTPTPAPPSPVKDDGPEPGEGEEGEYEPSEVLPLKDSVTAFGSDPKLVDFVISAPGTGPLHFTLTREGADRLRLRDFGYGHGPYRFGVTVKSDLLAPADYFDFAHRRYYVGEGCAELEVTPLGPVKLVVSDLYAKSPGRSSGWFSGRPKEKVRLAGMTFVQRKKTLLAVLGRSGAGKSSLLYALIGDLPLEGGSLFLEGLDMRTRSAQISDQLGYVPQETDLYSSLTVRQLLRYSSRLRDPRPERERQKTIAKVCAELRLGDDKLDQLVSTLSGGERRRASIAIELLSDPKLLILDEPTSGLDPGMDREIMAHLRDYAAKGNTVIVTTHATTHLRDRHKAATTEILVVADQGRPIFLGPPHRVLRRFGVRWYADLMDKLVDDEPGSWQDVKAQEYQCSGEVEEARREATAAASQATTRGAGMRSPHRVRHGSVRVFRPQLWTLIRRQATLLRVRGKTDNSGQTLRATVVALLPFLVVVIAAILAAQITPGSGLGARPGPAGNIALSVLTTLAMLSGQALTYGDLVSDFPIIRREHRTGVILPAVILSKWLVFAAVAVIEAALMTAAFVARRPGPAYSNVFPPFAELFVDLAALTVTAMSLGLLISSVARKLEQAVALVTLTSITQIALNGVTAQLSPGLNALAVLLPDRWGLAAAASSVDLDRISLPPHKPPDALWQHTSGQWTIDLVALAVLATSYAALATFVLWHRMRKRVPRRQVRARAARRSWRTT